MTRSLEEILNTPVEFKEGMRVFSLYTFKFATVDKIDLLDGHYLIDLLDDDGNETRDCYTIEGKYFNNNSTMRHLLTEQEAYELFPSLKPKVYEYQVVYKYKLNEGFTLSDRFFTSQEEFKNIVMAEMEFIELYQPSKRERK